MKKTIYNITTFAIIGFLSVHIILNKFMPNNVINILGYQTLVVLSPSMEPEIRVNDQVIIRKTTAEKIEVGDIITFEVYIPELRTTGYVTHYVADIGVNTDGELVYYTQGADAEPGEYDKWRQADGMYEDITYSNIIGEYWFKIPFIGYSRYIFNNPILLGVVSLNAVVVYYGLRYIKREKLAIEN